MVNTRQLLTDGVTFRWDIPSDVDGLVLFDIAFNRIRNGLREQVRVVKSHPFDITCPGPQAELRLTGVKVFAGRLTVLQKKHESRCFIHVDLFATE